MRNCRLWSLHLCKKNNFFYRISIRKEHPNSREEMGVVSTKVAGDELEVGAVVVVGGTTETTATSPTRTTGGWTGGSREPLTTGGWEAEAMGSSQELVSSPLLSVLKFFVRIVTLPLLLLIFLFFYFFLLLICVNKTFFFFFWCPKLFLKEFYSFPLHILVIYILLFVVLLSVLYSGRPNYRTSNGQNSGGPRQS